MRSHWVLVAAALALGPAAAADHDEDPGGPGGGDLQRARKAFAERRYDEAAAAARRAAAASPSSPEPLLALGRVAEFLGEFDQAKEAYGRARALAPDDPGAAYAAASLAVRLGEYDRALPLLDELLAGEDEETPWWREWVARYAPGLAPRRAPRRDPWRDRVRNLKIDVAMEKGDLAEARHLAREYELLQPGRNYCSDYQDRLVKQPDAAILPALRLAALGNREEWRCLFWFAARLTDDGFVRLAGAIIRAELIPLKLTGRDGAAVEALLRNRLSGGRDVAKRVEQLAAIGRQLYVRDGDGERAERALREAVRLDPAFPRPSLHLARIAWDREDRAGAVAWLEQAIRADPNLYDAYRILGARLEAMGRHAEAEAKLRKAVDLSGTEPGSRLALARILYARRQFDEYTALTEQVLRAERSPPGALTPVADFLRAFQAGRPAPGLPPAPHIALIAPRPFEY